MYGKDAGILSDLFGYQFKDVEDTITCGFPVASFKKVQAKLENYKINYIIINRRTNYSIEEKMNFKNLNTYNKHYEISKIYVKNQRKISKIYKYLTEKSKCANLIKVLDKIEGFINETTKI